MVMEVVRGEGRTSIYKVLSYLHSCMADDAGWRRRL
jgi:hypothetical protein